MKTKRTARNEVRRCYKALLNLSDRNADRLKSMDEQDLRKFFHKADALSRDEKLNGFERYAAMLIAGAAYAVMKEKYGIDLREQGDTEALSA